MGSEREKKMRRRDEIRKQIEVTRKKRKKEEGKQGEKKGK